MKEQPGTSYRDLYARRLVDMAIFLVVGSLFCDQAAASETKLAVARHWLAWRMPELHMCRDQCCSGVKAVVDDFETLAGPVPTVE